MDRTGAMAVAQRGSAQRGSTACCDRLAESTQRSKSFLAAEAIREFVENNEWQIAEIRAALKEANAGDFASDKDVATLAKKWKINAG